LRRRPVRMAAELRAQAWLGFGLYAVEQWAPVDLPRVLVTCGRRRATPQVAGDVRDSGVGLPHDAD